MSISRRLYYRNFPQFPLAQALIVCFKSMPGGERIVFSFHSIELLPAAIEKRCVIKTVPGERQLNACRALSNKR